MKYLEMLKNKLIVHRMGVEIGNPTNLFTINPVIGVNSEGNEHVIGVNVTRPGARRQPLGNKPYLPWDVFVAVISLLNLNQSEYGVIRGNAMAYRLGDAKLPLNSVEGHVANIVYGDQLGESVFRRSTPIAHILEWAEVCKVKKGYFKLIE